MSNRRIPENTEYFYYTDLNPKHLVTNDCVIRAVAYAQDISWGNAFDQLSSLARSNCRMPNAPQVYEKYLKQYGWVKQKQPRKPDGRKLTVWELAAQLRDEDAPVIVTMRGHMSVIDHGVVHDIWDCSYRCVSNYWIKDTCFL